MAALHDAYAWLRDYLTAIKAGQVHPFTRVERLAREATRRDPWGPTGLQLAELAETTHRPDHCRIVLAVLCYRLTRGPEKWRNVYKVGRAGAARPRLRAARSPGAAAPQRRGRARPPAPRARGAQLPRPRPQRQPRQWAGAEAEPPQPSALRAAHPTGADGHGIPPQARLAGLRRARAR
jgi:hypothetical protein